MGGRELAGHALFFDGGAGDTPTWGDRWRVASAVTSGGVEVVGRPIAGVGKQLTWGPTLLADPGFDSVSIRSNVGGRLDGIYAEQLSRPAQQRAHFVQLLLQPGISHMLKLPRPSYSHNSPPSGNG